ncbi:MAG: glycosyltransferase, partial [Methylococcales bacterium]
MLLFELSTFTARRFTHSVAFLREDGQSGFRKTKPEYTIMQSISLVIPVYCGEKTLPALVEEILPMTSVHTSPGGISFFIGEVLLVHDCGPDRSEETIEFLSSRYSFVRPVWLSRNYGQHAATLAGMASSTGDWVATIDEDGQQDPADIGKLLDAAISGSLQLVYAQPLAAPPHGWLR